MFLDHDAIRINPNVCKPRSPQKTTVYHKFKAIDSGMLPDDINGSEILTNTNITLDGGWS